MTKVHYIEMELASQVLPAAGKLVESLRVVAMLADLLNEEVPAEQRDSITELHLSSQELARKVKQLQTELLVGRA